MFANLHKPSMPFKLSDSFLPDGELILWETTESVRWFYERLSLSPALDREFRSISAENMRKQWLASRFILQQLARTAVLDIEKDAYGKPRFGNAERHISISHCQGYAAAIAGSYPVGIDVERIHERVRRIRDRFLSPEEVDLLGDELAYLMLAWSAKEAVYKMYGERGLIFKEDMCITAHLPAQKLLHIQLKREKVKQQLELSYLIENDLVLCWVQQPFNG